MPLHTLVPQTKTMADHHDHTAWRARLAHATPSEAARWLLQTLLEWPATVVPIYARFAPQSAYSLQAPSDEDLASAVALTGDIDGVEAEFVEGSAVLLGDGPQMSVDVTVSVGGSPVLVVPAFSTVNGWMVADLPAAP